MWATDVDVLPINRIIGRREGYWVVRSPSNPHHYWGNFLIFDDPPVAGDGHRWPARFEAEFGQEPQVRHHAFAWDRGDGAAPEAVAEFLADGFELERTAGLLARPRALRRHPRENRDVVVRPLECASDADQPFWEQVVEIWVAGRDERFEADTYRTFAAARVGDLRDLLVAGRGDWYVALDGDAVVASCGVVVTDGRARYQAVDTIETHRRRGICSRLLSDAASHAARSHAVERFVIAADPAYHALRIYESLGFERREDVCGLLRVSSGGT